MTGPAIAREDLASLLKWYVDNGIDETIGEEAIDRFAAPTPAAARAAVSAPEPAVAQPPAAPTPIPPATPFPPPPPVPPHSPQPLEDARDLARPRPPPP